MKDFLDKAAHAYFEGSPIITDGEWDFLARTHNYHEVGYTPTDGILHLFQMYSLQKCFDILNPPFPVTGDDVVASVKLDGAAVALLYINGDFQQALTRGDGIYGRDITNNMRNLVPSTINQHGLVQITGEVVAPSNIENARNYAAGALNLKSEEEFKSRTLFFYAYGIQSEMPYDTWTEDMEFLKQNDFNTVNTHLTDGFPTDGVVYRINNNEDFTKLGYTAKHPRGAFALKEMQEGVVTKLNDVKWQVGKSGVVSPVAILEPVMIGDATISRATLHNMDYIEELDLEIGCNVEIIRSGEIIPRVVRRV
jgi:NAD-dependent DNA ligase